MHQFKERLLHFDAFVVHLSFIVKSLFDFALRDVIAPSLNSCLNKALVPMAPGKRDLYSLLLSAVLITLQRLKHSGF